MTKRKQGSLMTRATIILLVLILPFNIIGIATSFLSYHNSIKNTENVISYTLNSYAMLLGNKITNANTALYELGNNNVTLLNMCSSSDESQYVILRYQFITPLDDKIKTSNSAETMFVYINEKEDYIRIPRYSATDVGEKPYVKYIENYDYSSSHWFLSEDKSELIRVLYDNSLNIYYGASIDLTEFVSKLDGLEGFDTLNFSFNETELSSSSSQLCFNNEIADGIYLTANLASRELNNSIGFIQPILILFFILYLALIPCLFFPLRRFVGNPLKTLNHANSQLQEGNEDYRILEHGNSQEFHDAYESFNRMACAQQQLHREIMEKELSNKQLVIDFLQLQIRPHFLLNSFNVLYTLIQQMQKELAQEMVLFLSDYFRYLFRSGRELQLFSKERKLIENYMNISKISYPVSFEVSYQIDPILELMRVPPLLLHSFMENIVAHALLPDKQVHIVFSGEYNNGIVTFIISDNGKGIDADALYSINHIEDRTIDDGKNVGIKNSIWRLKYYYGDEATVECDSEPNVGTTFIITIPYNLED